MTRVVGLVVHVRRADVGEHLDDRLRAEADDSSRVPASDQHRLDVDAVLADREADRR